MNTQNLKIPVHQRNFTKNRMTFAARRPELESSPSTELVVP